MSEDSKSPAELLKEEQRPFVIRNKRESRKKKTGNESRPRP